LQTLQGHGLIWAWISSTERAWVCMCSLTDGACSLTDGACSLTDGAL